jgi:hypothetical protein
MAQIVCSNEAEAKELAATIADSAQVSTGYDGNIVTTEANAEQITRARMVMLSRRPQNLTADEVAMVCDGLNALFGDKQPGRRDEARRLSARIEGAEAVTLQPRPR